MSAWSRLKGIFGSGEAEKSAGGLMASVLQSGLAPRRGTLELLQAYRTHPWFHAVVHRIASDVGGHPLELYRSKKPSARSERRFTRSAVAYSPKDSVEIESHEFLTLLGNPNPVMSRGAFQYLITAYLDTKGEVPVVVERGAGGSPMQLWPVPPNWLIELPHRAYPFYRFSHLSWQRTIPEDDVVYIRHPDLEQPFGRGVGFGETLSDEIDVDEYATKHLKQWFFNRALPDVFLYVEGIKNAAQAKEYEEILRQKHGGRGKNNQVHVTNGKVDIKQLGSTFREQMLPELRSQERDIILQVFSMPPEAMGIIENSNRATIDAANYLLTKGVVSPRLAHQADAWTMFVRREWQDDSLAVGFCSPVPEDAAFSLSVMQSQPSLFTKNEWRELASKPPIEGWDEEFPSPPSALPFGAGAPSDGPSATEGPEDQTEDEMDEEEPAEPVETEDPEAKSAGRSLRPVVRQVSQADIDRVISSLKPERLDRVTNTIVDTVQSWGTKTLTELGSVASFDIRNPLVTEYLDAWKEQRIVGITATTRADVTDVLRGAVADGVGIDEARRRLRGYFEQAADYRAERIARTEIVSSANAANLAAYQISGLVDGKEWLAVQDGQTRDTHRHLDGQRTGITGEFVSSSGARTQGPGLFGVAEEDINCRCTLRPVIKDLASPEGEERAIEWRKWDSSLVSYQASIGSSAAKVFGEWLGDAVVALG
jgi:SPP1 gp7 family putative phage head morphogenesis protein